MYILKSPGRPLNDRKEKEARFGKKTQFIDNHFNIDISNPAEVLMRTKLLIEKRKKCR